MPATTATAPGKIILLGEHAVVYGRPAIAVPVTQVRARAVVKPAPGKPAGWVRLQAPAIELDADLEALRPEHPLGVAVRAVLDELDIDRPPACTIRVTSTIPIAAGLGSGAAISVALIRALADFLGRPLPDERVSALAFEVEKLHHGTPSGVDNTVITYAMPVYFVRGQPIERLQVNTPFTFVVADTGVPSPTATTVGDVRQGWQANPPAFEHLFDAIQSLVRAARACLERGNVEDLGPLMSENHRLLREMGVSSLELDHLVKAALAAGSLGAKLSGGGRGGNMIALAPAEEGQVVADALRTAGAHQVFLTTVGGPQKP